jgi:microtubule-associated protein-like 5
MFDDDNNLLIDGLELFAGLILFTDNCKFEDKIKFIFDIYDFNDLNSLSKTDLEFLFISTCSACNKIMGVKSKTKQD